MVRQQKNSVAQALGGCILGLLMAHPAQALLIESGDFIDEIERLRDLTFTSGSNLYVGPTQNERSDFRTLAQTLQTGDTATADTQAAALDYEVVRYTDNTTNQTFLGLREQLVNNAQTRGWGSFFFNETASVNVLVEAPHPRFDSRSSEIAATVYRDASAAGFLMAGAHRNSNGSDTADVAHLSDSIFQEVHEAWTEQNGERDAWQLHGFNLANHNPPMPGDTDVVVSGGEGDVSEGMLAVNQFMESGGFVTYGYNTLNINDALNQQINGNVDGQDFSGLGGTSNVQGQYTRSVGADFVHIEMAQSIRFDSNNRALASAAIVSAMDEVYAAPIPSVLLLMGLPLLGLVRYRHWPQVLTAH